MSKNKRVKKTTTKNTMKKTTKSISQQINSSIPYEEQMDIIAPHLSKFVSEFGEYIIPSLELLKVETLLNYIPLRNHRIAVEMLSSDYWYNELSESETFDWKNNFLTDEQVLEHEQKMSFQFRDKCHDWLNSEKKLVKILKLTYSNQDDYIHLFDCFAKMIWDFNQFEHLEETEEGISF